jgi:DUF4097 and DUF4098 domain-containing protein YvlB
MSGFHEEARDTWSKTYPLGANGKLEIVNTNGTITVDASDSPQVEIHAERIARAGTPAAAKELLEKSQIREDVSSDVVHLESRSPTGFGFRGNTQVEYRIRVPAAAVVHLQDTNGRIIVNGLSHETHLQTTNGQIEAKHLDGEVRASTTNGSVELEMKSVSKDIEVRTTNGPVSVVIPKSSSAQIAAQVTNGHIEVNDLSVQPEGENSRRQYNARVNGGGPRIEVQTTNGGITIAGR